VLNTYLVRIAADARYPLDTEVEWACREAGALEEGHDEATEATVNMHANVVFLRERAERYNVILVSVGEVNCGSNKLQDMPPSDLMSKRRYPNIIYHDSVRVAMRKWIRE
jgi:hypothetical protein